jgi:hypothetical protein
MSSNERHSEFHSLFRSRTEGAGYAEAAGRPTSAQLDVGLRELTDPRRVWCSVRMGRRRGAWWRIAPGALLSAPPVAAHRSRIPDRTS